MIAYDANYTPPAPLIAVEIGGLVRSPRRRTLTALLDTGADITAIPEALVELMHLYPTGRLQLESVDGRFTPAFTYTVQLKLADVLIPQMEVVLTRLEYVVLGRDVLNRFYVQLDGPELAFALATYRQKSIIQK